MVIIFFGGVSDTHRCPPLLSTQCYLDGLDIAHRQCDDYIAAGKYDGRTRIDLDTLTWATGEDEQAGGVEWTQTEGDDHYEGDQRHHEELGEQTQQHGRGTTQMVEDLCVCVCMLTQQTNIA